MKKYLLSAIVGGLILNGCGRDERQVESNYTLPPMGAGSGDGSGLECLPKKPTPKPTPTPTPTVTPTPCPTCPACPTCPEPKPCPPQTPCPKCPDQTPPDQKPVPPKPPVQNPPVQNPPTQNPVPPVQNPQYNTYVRTTPCPCADAQNYWMDVNGQWHRYGEQTTLVGTQWMDSTGQWHPL